MDTMVRRVAAAQAAVDAFHFKPFTWGACDCARLAAFVLRELGHKPKLASFGRYANALSAQRALERKGFKDLSEVMDAMGFPRIPPAAMLPSDIAGYRHATQDLPVGLCVSVGGGRVLGFLEDLQCHIFRPTYGADGADYYAWRTPV